MRTSTRPGDGRGPLREEWFTTPYGAGRVTLRDGVPFALDLPEPGRRPPADAAAGPWARRLEAYFAGEPVAFDLDVAAHCRLHGRTRFETDVYAALARVPYGRAVSYRDLAHAVGRPNAYRAVGSAMARNALPVILPCHRVVRNDGTPGEYGDDPTWKVRLLELEGVLVPGAPRVTPRGAVTR